MRQILKKSLFINKIIFYYGYFIFRISNKTPKISLKALINLYCLTNGVFTTNFHNHLKKFKTNDNQIKSDFFEEITENEVKTVSKKLKEEGYSLFPLKLKSNVVSQINKLALDLKSEVSGEKINFNPNSIKSNIYRFNKNDLMNNPTIQKLIMDPILTKVAKNYLESEPVFDHPALWWSTDFNKNISGDGAQKFHFDFERLKWIKIFFYMSDVDEYNGPHCYISSTHKDNSKPNELLDKGYSRIDDKEIRNFYEENRFKELKGESGTILFGDTLCWHKGKPIKKGNRLMLQFQYTSSLFGVNQRLSVSKKNSREFYKFSKKNKFYTKNINFVN